MKTTKNKKIYLLIILIFLVFILFTTYINKKSYALEDKYNYLGDYILNPEWVNYMDLSNKEKLKYNVIPEKFIVSSKLINKISLFSNRNTYPEYYNLNDLGYSTKPRNQYGLGICWAFAAIASVESNMLINGMSNINNPIIFSERQLDYAGVHKNYIKEGYNPYAISTRTYPGSGAFPKTAFSLFGTGISPVTTEIFGWFNEDKDVKSMKEIFNLDNIEYVVDGYVNIGSLGDYSDEETRTNWIKNVKNHVINHGAVAISSIGPLAGYGGSCLYKDKNNNYMLNVQGDCNPLDENNEHAMAIIGWDDNYQYQYCRKEDETTNDLTNCNNIIKGKGAFILKNSWGDVYPYPYFAYTSNVDGAYGVTRVSQKNFDVNYDFTKSNTSKYEHKESIITYDRSSQIKENLVKISFYTNTNKDINYNIYLNSNNKEYNHIDSVIINNIGLNTIYVDNIPLTEDKFSIKITSDDGYIDEIYAYTKYTEEESTEIIDTKIKTGNQYKSTFTEFSLYTATKNIPVGETIEYKFIKEDGKDITNLVTIENNIVLNNMVNPKFTINEIFPLGKINLQTIYKEKVYDTEEIEILYLKNLWSDGSGTIDDPFLIKDIDDFLKIYTDKDYLAANYKLTGDIDFSKVENWNIGEYTDYQSFTGTLDGDGHIISGLNCNSNLCSLFYQLNEATIKNIIFTSFKYNVSNYGWGNLLGIVSYNSTFENIIITRSVEINGQGTYMGGLIGSAYNSSFINIANHANINSEYEYYNGKTSGIVNEAYGSEIKECYNYGNITSNGSVASGIVSYLGNYSQTENVGKITDSYNLGNILTNNIGGGIVGEGASTIINNTYNIYTSNNKNVGNIVGKSYGMVIKNSYYLENYGPSIYVNEENTTTLVNVTSKSKEQLINKTTYQNFDFENIWTIENNYPYIKEFNYIHIENIEINNSMELILGQKIKLNIKYTPENPSIKKLKYTIDKNNIIDIDDNFNITAIGNGSVTLIIYTIDGSEIEKEINITVNTKKINLDNYEIIDNKYIKIAKITSKNDFIKNITINNLYKINIISNNQNISTGDKIQIYNQNNIKEEEYKIFVMGDITGTGNINVTDVSKLYQYIKGKIKMDKEYVLAADLVKDNELKVNDVSKLYQYIKNKIPDLN